MRLTVLSLVVAMLLSGSFVFSQDGGAPRGDRPQQRGSREGGPRGPRGGFMPGFMGAQEKPLFGENLEEADFPEGVWYFNDDKELCANADAVIWTKNKYSTFTCSFEFNLSEHTNGGFLIQCSDKDNWIPNTIEIQLLDDYGTEPDYHSCGAFYGFQAATKNVTKKPGEWNKMDVFVNNRMITVVLNGEMINRINTAEWTDNAKSPQGTDIEEKFHGRSLASFEPYGYVGFQGLHGNAPMKIRNATIRPIANADTTREGWVSLFGDKLENAEYNPEVWSIDEEGQLTATKDEVIWAKDKYENFMLDFEFKTTDQANSGVVIQATEKDNWIPNSFEVQIFDSFGRDVDMSDCGAIYGRCAPQFNACKAPGEWNHMTISVMGPMITVVLNDQLITTMDKRLWTKADENPDGTKPYEWLVNKAPSETENAGYIGIQGLHGNPTVYRNVKIRKIEFPRRGEGRGPRPENRE
ncbi:MAG: DUF1080 domain-containing protein [Planctomycetia bacterium]|nr:DUF1080 domain-containing protein [Planctomycetia bacterium]